jgi:hypothetical protein
VVRKRRFAPVFRADIMISSSIKVSLTLPELVWMM